MIPNISQRFTWIELWSVLYAVVAFPPQRFGDVITASLRYAIGDGKSIGSLPSEDLKVVGSHPESSFDLWFWSLSFSSIYRLFSRSLYHCFFNPWLLHEAGSYPGSETDSGCNVGDNYSGLEWALIYGRKTKAVEIKKSSKPYANAPEQKPSSCDMRILRIGGASSKCFVHFLDEHHKSAVGSRPWERSW